LIHSSLLTTKYGNVMLFKIEFIGNWSTLPTTRFIVCALSRNSCQEVPAKLAAIDPCTEYKLAGEAE